MEFFRSLMTGAPRTDIPRRQAACRARRFAGALRVLCLLLACLALPAPSALAGGELVFGMSAAFSGPARGLGMEYQRGLMAAFERVNAQGGAGGWRLALSLRDDAYDPATALRNTIEFVEKERVFALLGYVGTPTTARVMPLLKRYESSSVSMLFPLTGTDMLREHSAASSVYNLRASYLDETNNLVEALLAEGNRRIAVFHQADVYGRSGWDGVRRTLRVHGLSIVSEATYRRGAVYGQDLRREVALILDGRPDAIVTVGTAPACAAFVRDLRDAGFTQTVAALSFADADNLASFLLEQKSVTGRDYLKGLVFSQVVPCYEDESLPAARAYRQAMQQMRAPLPPQRTAEAYTPHPLSFVGFEGFLAGMTLAEAVKRMADGPSRERLRTVFANLKSVDLGLGEKVDMRPGEGQGIRRTFLAIFKNGHFQSTDSLKEVRR